MKTVQDVRTPSGASTDSAVAYACRVITAMTGRSATVSVSPGIDAAGPVFGAGGSRGEQGFVARGDQTGITHAHAIVPLAGTELSAAEPALHVLLDVARPWSDGERETGACHRHERRRAARRPRGTRGLRGRAERAA